MKSLRVERHMLCDVLEKSQVDCCVEREKVPDVKSEHEASQDGKMYPPSFQADIMEGKYMSGAYFLRCFRDHIRERPGKSRSTV